MKPSFECWLAALSIAFGSLVAAQPVAGQHAEKIYSVGILCGGCSDQDPGRGFADTRQALRERGYVEGRNIAFVYRSAEGSYEKLPGLAADLVRAKVDVIMAGGGLPGALAAKNATTTIPIIFVGIGEDPVQHGLVSSLSRPGGNVTGLVDRYADLIPKQLALLKEAVPGLSRVGVLWDARLKQALEPSFQAMQSALPSLGLQHYAIAVNGPDDLPDALRAARARGHRGAHPVPVTQILCPSCGIRTDDGRAKNSCDFRFYRFRSGWGFFVVRSERRKNLAVCRVIGRQDF